MALVPSRSGSSSGSESCALEAVGLVTPLGSGVPAVLPRLIAASPHGLVPRAGLLADRELLVGAVEDASPVFPNEWASYRCRNNALAWLALDQIKAAIEHAVARFGAHRIGVVAGTSTSGLAETGAAVSTELSTGRIPPGFHYAQFEHGGLADFVAEWSGAEGPAYTVSTACSSSAKALLSGRALLQMGVCDAVIVGGADTLCPLTARGFTALEAVSDTPSNPFSRNRRGLNLGEAAAFFLMTKAAGGIQLCGGGESSDHHHISAPDPSGAGAERALRAALADARAESPDVVYVNLHGTGTLLNDAMESRAVERVLGCDVPCSSTKPLTGHALGAAGALEIAFCWMILDGERNGRIALPPHVFDGVRDPELSLIRLVQRGESVRAHGRRLVLSNSFGFGGNNCIVALERGER